MEMKGGSISRVPILFVVLSVLFSFTVAFAQLDELEEIEIPQEKVKCKPDSFVTDYDTLAVEDIDPQQVNIWFSLAREEFKYNNYKRAIPYYWRVLVNDKANKFSKFVYSKLAECYYNLNQPDSVLLVVYRGLEQFPDYTTLHYWGGLVHDRLGNTECAIPHYEALTQADPKNKTYWSKLAFFYYKTENPKAIEAQRHVVEIDPQDVDASHLLAEIMEFFGEDPLKARKQTFLKDTTNIDNAMRYAKAAYDRGLYQEAIYPFKVILKAEPKNVVALEYLGRCYEGLNQLSQSLQYYKEILNIEPRNVKIMCLTASVYGRLKQFSTARSYVNRALRVEPQNGLPHMIMAEIYENAIQYCSEQRNENKLTYDDKLVYRLAQLEYQKAAKDPTYSSDAKRRIQQLEALVPTKSDLFMHKNRLKTEEACYEWINQ
ncbi:MAG: hypothetical protein Kow0042_15490 [Calditrichia bacterium]